MSGVFIFYLLKGFNSILQYVGLSTKCRNISYNILMKNNFFGLKLKELRVEKGLSQRKLGEVFGVCNQTVSFWESGSREPDMDTLSEIADYFEVSVDFLLGRKDL